MFGKKRLNEEAFITSVKQNQNIDSHIQLIYLHYYESSEKLILKMNGSQQDAEDVFQEAVVDLIRSILHDKFRKEAAISTFLYSVCRNKWLDQLKKRKLKDRYQHTLKASFSEEILSEGEINLEEEDNRKLLLQVFQKLGEASRKVLYASYMEDLDVAEITQRFGYSSDQIVYNTKHRCMSKLKELLITHPEISQDLKDNLNT